LLLRGGHLFGPPVVPLARFAPAATRWVPQSAFWAHLFLGPPCHPVRPAHCSPGSVPFAICFLPGMRPFAGTAHFSLHLPSDVPSWGAGGLNSTQSVCLCVCPPPSFCHVRLISSCSLLSNRKGSLLGASYSSVPVSVCLSVRLPRFLPSFSSLLLLP
jgi:hypothetical protein